MRFALLACFVCSACGTVVDAPGAEDVEQPAGDVEEEADVEEEEAEEEAVVVDDSDDEEAAGEGEGEGEGEGDEEEAPTPEPTPEPTPPTPPTPTTTTTNPPQATERALSVLQWNIAGGKENACQTAGITRAVRRYVVEHDVDFVSLNEVCPGQHTAIREMLRELWGKGPNARFSAYVGDGDGNHAGHTVGNGLYSKRNIEDVLRLKVGEDQYGDRNLLCARVKSQPHLRLCSTHLTPGDAAARRQLVTVQQRVERYWDEDKDTVVFAGDLNLNADDHGLDVVYAAAADTHNNGGNHGRYREVDDDDAGHCRGYGERSHAGSGGPCNSGGKIDFIFARQNRIAGGEHRGDSLDIPQDCTGACSDHRAIVGSYRLKIRVE